MHRGIRAALLQSCSRRCFQSVAYNPFTINLFQPCTILLQQAAEQMADFQRAPFKRTDMLELSFQPFRPPLSWDNAGEDDARCRRPGKAARPAAHGLG